MLQLSEKRRARRECSISGDHDFARHHYDHECESVDADAGHAVRGVSTGDFEQHLPDLDEGVPEEIWSSRDDVVYALGLNADGRLLAERETRVHCW